MHRLGPWIYNGRLWTRSPSFFSCPFSNPPVLQGNFFQRMFEVSWLAILEKSWVVYLRIRNVFVSSHPKFNLSQCEYLPLCVLCTRIACLTRSPASTATSKSYAMYATHVVLLCKYPELEETMGRQHNQLADLCNFYRLHAPMSLSKVMTTVTSLCRRCQTELLGRTV